MLVVDASAIAKIYIREEGSDAALRIVAAEDHKMVPAHAFAEVGELLTRKVHLGVLGETQLAEALSALRLRFRQVALDELIGPAVRISLETGASVYDCLYVALAVAESCPLVTADRRLVEKMSMTPHAGLLTLLDSSIASR